MGLKEYIGPPAIGFTALIGGACPDTSVDDDATFEEGTTVPGDDDATGEPPYSSTPLPSFNQFECPDGNTIELSSSATNGLYKGFGLDASYHVKAVCAVVDTIRAKSQELTSDQGIESGGSAIEATGQFLDDQYKDPTYNSETPCDRYKNPCTYTDANGKEAIIVQCFHPGEEPDGYISNSGDVCVFSYVDVNGSVAWQIASHVGCLLGDTETTGLGIEATGSLIGTGIDGTVMTGACGTYSLN